MKPLATVTITVQDRLPPLGPSIAVTVFPDPATIVASPAVQLWVLLRAHIQTLIASKESPRARSRPEAKPPSPLRRASHNSPAKGSPQRVRKSSGKK